MAVTEVTGKRKREPDCVSLDVVSDPEALEGKSVAGQTLEHKPSSLTKSQVLPEETAGMGDLQGWPK